MSEEPCSCGCSTTPPTESTEGCSCGCSDSQKEQKKDEAVA